MLLATASQSRILKKLCALLLCALIAACNSNSVKQNLRYHMMKGVTYKYAATFEMKNTSQLSGEERTSVLSGPGWISLTVDDVGKDGEIICRGKLDSAIFRFDSWYAKDSLVGREFIGKNVRIVFSPIGKTLSVTLVDSLAAGAGVKAFNEFDPMKLLPSILFHLPEHEVGIGDSWTLDSVAAPQVPGFKSTFEMSTTFEIVGTERIGAYDCFKISIDGSGITHLGGKTPSGMESVVDMKTRATGVVYFAQKEGILVSVEQSGSTKMTASTGSMESTSDGTQNRRLTLVQ